MMPRRSIDRLLNASSGISVQPPPPPSAGGVCHRRRAAGSNLPARVRVLGGLNMRAPTKDDM